jgi:hypothetical protein
VITFPGRDIHSLWTLCVFYVAFIIDPLDMSLCLASVTQ